MDRVDDEQKFVYYENLVDVIGPLYSVDDGLRESNILNYCRMVWGDNGIPFVFGRQGMGKSNILRPYLEEAEDALVLEPKDPRLYRLEDVVQKTVFLGTVHGRNEKYHEVECTNLIGSVCADNGLFSPPMFHRGRLMLVVDEEDVDEMALTFASLGVSEKSLGLKYRLGRERVVRAFRQFDMPVIRGIAELTNLLGVG